MLHVGTQKVEIVEVVREEEEHVTEPIAAQCAEIRFPVLRFLDRFDVFLPESLVFRGSFQQLLRLRHRRADGQHVLLALLPEAEALLLALPKQNTHRFHVSTRHRFAEAKNERLLRFRERR